MHFALFCLVGGEYMFPTYDEIRHTLINDENPTTEKVVEALWWVNGVIDLVETPYWSRMWTLQEYLLAPKPPLCHTTLVTVRFNAELESVLSVPMAFIIVAQAMVKRWKEMASASPLAATSSAVIERDSDEAGRSAALESVLQAYHRRLETVYPDSSKSSSPIPSWKDVNDQKNKYEVPNPFQRYLIQTADLRFCKDPRDRIFALFGLLPSAMAAMPPDYDKPVDLVMRNAATYILTHDGDDHDIWFAFPRRPDRLSAIKGTGNQIDQADRVATDAENICPSWVPDFSHYRTFMQKGIVYDDSDSVPLLSSDDVEGDVVYVDKTIDPSTLHLRGRYLGHVQILVDGNAQTAQLHDQIRSLLTNIVPLDTETGHWQLRDVEQNTARNSSTDGGEDETTDDSTSDTRGSMTESVVDKMTSRFKLRLSICRSLVRRPPRETNNYVERDLIKAFEAVLDHGKTADDGAPGDHPPPGNSCIAAVAESLCEGAKTSPSSES